MRDCALARRELLGRVVDLQKLEVVSYVAEQEVHRIRPGDSGLFITEGAGGASLPVRNQQGVLYPEQPVYRVVMDVVSTEALPAWAAQHRWRGRVSIRGDWEAPGAQFVRTAASVFWREAGF
ncbi:hypothetical protein KXJ72_14940 [Comamonas aquatica]|nr:hypothetical protein KXJ72_14940 [Comamonas aquatica]